MPATASRASRIAAGDPDDRLSFRIATPVVSVPPGGRTNVTISVGTRDRMWTGAPVTRPFQVVGQPRWCAADHARRLAAAAPAIFVGTSQILTVAVVVGVAGLLASQLLPALVSSPSSTPSPSAAAATGPSGGLAAAGSSLSATPPPSGRADDQPPPSGAARIDDGAGRLDGRAEHGDHRPGDRLADPDAGPVVCPPMAIRILNLGLADPLGQPMPETPTPRHARTTPGPGSSSTAAPSFPIVIASPQADGGPDRTEGPCRSAALALQRRFAPRLPRNRIRRRAAGAAVRRAGQRPSRRADHPCQRHTTPTICLSRRRSEPACARTTTSRERQGTSGTEAQTWFLSVQAQQGGTSVDVRDRVPRATRDVRLQGPPPGGRVGRVRRASS